MATSLERDRYLRKTYGISHKEYNRLLTEQGGVCAICRREPGKRKLCVDHCHKTQNVRGILCHRCNRGIAWFSDDPARLRAAAEYSAAPPAYGVIGQRPVPERKRRRRRLTL